ncbi:MAG: DNA cytosine methyltransferase [Candidatus Poribacteria bacterium]|nr:DNA cytosine methyltransferase [Candidatus Poribacteria bacterium]
MIKAIDFFCGAGGLTRGLLDAGIGVLAGVDNDERLQDTYTHNNKPSRFINKDIGKIEIQELRKELGIQDEDTTLYAACTPCQPFSTLSRQNWKDDSRKVLLLSFAEIVKECPPDFILVENVPGLNNNCGKEIYEKFLEVLEECEFSEPAADLLDAKHFGVPQTRKRFILLASKKGSISLPTPQTDPDKFVTVKKCIENYPDVDAKEAQDYSNHVARELKPHHKRIVEAVPKDGGSRRDVTDTTILLKCHQEKPNAHRDVFGRMAWNKPAPTLTSRCTDVYSGRFIHPKQDRGISLREAAALQTFKDNYKFFGTSISAIARQIGNAVPVKLAEYLGKSIINAFEQNR